MIQVFDFHENTKGCIVIDNVGIFQCIFLQGYLKTAFRGICSCGRGAVWFGNVPIGFTAFQNPGKNPGFIQINGIDLVGSAFNYAH